MKTCFCVWFTCLCICILLSELELFTFAETGPENQCSASVEKIEALKAQVFLLMAKMSNVRIQEAEQSTKLATLETRISDQDTEIANQNTKISDQDTKIANQNTKISDQDTKIARQDINIARQRSDIDDLFTKIAEKCVDGTNNLPSALQNLTEKVINNGNTINTIVERIAAREKLDRPLIAFYADLTTQSLRLQRNNVLIFNQIITNWGDGYNRQTGVFTAPVKGIYIFSWTISGKHNAAIVTRLTVNGMDVGNIFADGASRGGFVSSASKTTILTLSKGDSVSVRGGHLARGNLWSDSAQECSFSGALLFKL